MSAIKTATAATLLVGMCATAGDARSASNSSASNSRSASNTRHSHSTYKGTISRQDAMADSLLRKGDLAQSAEMFKAQLNRNSKDVNARAGLAMAYAKQFKLDRADEECNKVLKSDPQNPMAHCGKALVLLSRLQSSSTTYSKNKAALLRQAGSECNLALTADPTLPEASCLLGQIFKEEGRLDKAEEAFNGAIKLDHSYSDAYAGLGLTNLLKGDSAQAMTNFKQAIALNSGNYTAHYGLGRSYLQQGLTDQALAELNTALYQFPNSAPVHFEMGKVYQTQGNTVAAVKEFQESIRIKPENAAPYINIADIRENRGDIEAAIAELRSGLEMLPNNPDLRLRVANNNLRLEKLDDAIKDYEAVMAVNPRSTQAAEGLTRGLYLKAQKQTTGAFMADNDYETAERSLARAIAMNPNNMQLRLADAKLHALSGEKVDLSRIGTPQNDGDRIAYAEALLAQDRFKEASDQFDQLIANNNDPKTLMQIGELALMVRDLDSSQKALSKAASVSGNDQRAQRGLDQVAKARQANKENLNLANDLARRKQLASAIDKYHSAVYSDPRNAEARQGLAQSLERFYSDNAKELRESASQYKAFLALSSNLPAKEQEKLEKHITHLETKAAHLEQVATLNNGKKGSGLLARFHH